MASMKQPLGITFTAKPGQPITGVYEADGGAEVFETDAPYLLSDGRSLASPLPVFDAGGPTFMDGAGGLQAALAVSGLTPPIDWDWQTFALTAGTDGVQWVGYSDGGATRPQPAFGSINRQPTPVTTLLALYDDTNSGVYLAVFAGDFVDQLDGLQISFGGFVMTAFEIELIDGNTWLRFTGLPGDLTAGATYEVEFGWDVWTPTGLFGDGQPGHWSGGYDPALGRLWQNAGGTVPVTDPGQPVGFVQDMSQGGVMGPELVTNGGFDTGTTGWTGINSTLAEVDGVCQITATVENQARASQSFATVVGRTYEATAILYRGTGSQSVNILIPGIASSANVSATTPTKVKMLFVASDTSTTIRVGSTGASTVGATYFADNVSVRELPGNHATQPTALSRPTLARWPKGGRRNLITDTESINLWTTGGEASISAGHLAPDGTNTSFLISGVVGNTRIRVPSFTPKSGSSYCFHFSVRGVSGTLLVYNPFTSSVVPVAISSVWSTVIVTGTASSTNSAEFQIRPSIGSEIYIWHPQVELGTSATTYQKVTTQYDIIEAGVPDVWHLSNDGGDSLPITLPAGTYGRATVNAAGLVTVDTVVDPADALVSNQQVDVILRQGAFTSEEEADIRTYWARYAA